jgi:type VI secretion system secreted protein VgrG
MVVDGAAEAVLNGEYIVTELRSSGKRGEDACENDFAAIPKDAPFAAPRRTPKPVILGVQTAVVTGPSNEPEAIHTDKYGRVKVRFFWDRSGKQDGVQRLAAGVAARAGWVDELRAWGGRWPAYLTAIPTGPRPRARLRAEHSAVRARRLDGSFKTRSTRAAPGSTRSSRDTGGSRGLSSPRKGRERHIEETTRPSPWR